MHPICLKNSKKAGETMKKHKLFSWLTVAFFLLTIVTGYERK